MFQGPGVRESVCRRQRAVRISEKVVNKPDSHYGSGIGVLELQSINLPSIDRALHHQITNNTTTRPPTYTRTQRTIETWITSLQYGDTTRYTYAESGAPGSEWPPWPQKAATRPSVCPCRRATHCRCRRHRKLRSGISFTREYGVNARQKSRVCPLPPSMFPFPTIPQASSLRVRQPFHQHAIPTPNSLLFQRQIH